MTSSQLRQQLYGGGTPRSLPSAVGAISNWLGGVLPGSSPIPTTDPASPNYTLPSGDLLPTPNAQTGTVNLIQGHRYAAGIQAPDGIPINVLGSSIAMLPGFSGGVVYTVAPGPNQFPGAMPAGGAQGANYVLTATYSNPSANGVPLPTGVMWVYDWLPDAYPSNPIPAPSPNGSGGGAPVPSVVPAASGLILGMKPASLALIAAAVVVGGVIIYEVA